MRLFSGTDAFITSEGGTNHFFGGGNGGVFTGQVTNFNSIFENKAAFNADIDSWDEPGNLNEGDVSRCNKL